MKLGKHDLYHSVADPGGYGIFLLDKKISRLHHVDF
jgi:hypothetical protein